MAQLQPLTVYKQILIDVKQSLDNYNYSIINELFEIEEGEDYNNAYNRGESIFDQYENDINNIEEIIQQENLINDFFFVCKENKQKLIDEKNVIINKLLRIKKNDPNVSKDEYLNCRDFWNKKRIESPDERNRRECEEMLEEMKEKEQTIREITQIVTTKINELNDKENDLKEEENVLKELKNEITKKIKELEAVNEEVQRINKYKLFEQKMKQLDEKYDTNIKNMEKAVSNHNKENDKRYNEFVNKTLDKLNKYEEYMKSVREMKDNMFKAFTKYVAKNEYEKDLETKLVNKNELQTSIQQNITKIEEVDKKFGNYSTKNDLHEIKMKCEIEENKINDMKISIQNIENQNNQNQLLFVSKREQQDMDNKIEELKNEMKQQINNKISRNEVDTMINNVVEKCVQQEEFKEIKNSIFNMKPLPNGRNPNINSHGSDEVDPITNLSGYEKRKLSGFTSKWNYDNVIFDSDKNNWNDTKKFHEYVFGKKDLLFIIEDENGNKFGGYLFATISTKWWSNYIEDKNAFLFSLRSNGRLTDIIKFKIHQNSTKAFTINSSGNKILFAFGEGYDICVYSKDSQLPNQCAQKSFDYLGYSHALCGGELFDMKRFVVIQMK